MTRGEASGKVSGRAGLAVRLYSLRCAVPAGSGRLGAPRGAAPALLSRVPTVSFPLVFSAGCEGPEAGQVGTARYPERQ